MAAFRRTKLNRLRGVAPLVGGGAAAVAGAVDVPAGVEPVSVEPVSVEPVSVEPVRIHPAGVDPAGVEKRIEDLLHAIPEALVLVSDDGVVALANRRAEQIFRATPGGLVGYPAADLLPAYPSLSPGMIDTGAEIVARRAGGSEFPAQISLNPPASAAGAIA